MAWTEEMINRLETMWQEGLTTSEIAKNLGVSKNSIVGKVHRLNLPARPSPIRKKDGEEDDLMPELPLETTSEPAPAPKPEPTPEPEPTLAPEPKQSVVSAKKTPATSVESKNTENGKKANPSSGVTLTELGNHTCRWPLGDPRDENFCFCGKKVRSGQTYCEEHSAIAYVKPVKKG